jgi:peptide/nickel transport system permease protein
VTGYVLRRLLTAVPALALTTVVVFGLVAAAGDPLAELRARQPSPPAAVIELRERELHLDRPLPERYAIWVSGALRGDLGRTVDGQQVAPLLAGRLLVTLRMVLPALALACALAVAAGLAGAARPHSALDHGTTVVSLLFLSTPVFWLAALLKEYVALRVNQLVGHQVVYTVGAESPYLTGGWLTRVTDHAGHLALPTVALALVTYAAWSRYQRTSLLEALASPYVRQARAKGLRPWQVLRRHALRTALLPLTSVVAVDFAAVLGGAVVTEQVFSWQGMGLLLLEGVQDHDVNVVLGWLLVSGSLVILLNLAADLLSARLDPRVRLVGHA